MNDQKQDTQAGTTQSLLRATLERAGIPSLEIKCYGSQVMVTAKGHATAEKWASVLAKFCGTVRAPRESWEMNRADADRSRPRHYKVWRVWGTV